MRARIGDAVYSNELAVFVHVKVIFVAVVILPTFLRPAGIGILLPRLGWAWTGLGGRIVPRNWYRAVFDQRPALHTVSLDRHRHERDLSELSAVHPYSRDTECLIK